MAKNMARLDENGNVINIEWCSNTEDESAVLIDLKDRFVSIGDFYDGTYFYHEGEIQYTPLEQAQMKIYDLETIQADTDSMLVDYEYRLTMLEPALMDLDVGGENSNKILYRTLKRIVKRSSVKDIETKINIFFANGKITEDEYNELLQEVNNNG